jgi:hypothetical protein
MNEKGYERSVVTLLKVLCRHFLEELRKTTMDLSQDSRSTGRDLDPGPPEYGTGVNSLNLCCTVRVGDHVSQELVFQ